MQAPVPLVGRARFLDLAIKDGRHVFWLSEDDVGYIMLGQLKDGELNSFICIKVRWRETGRYYEELVFVTFTFNGYKTGPVTEEISPASFVTDTQERVRSCRLRLNDYLAWTRAKVAIQLDATAMPWGLQRELFARNQRLVRRLVIGLVRRAIFAGVLAPDKLQYRLFEEQLRNNGRYTGPLRPQNGVGGLEVWLMEFVIRELIASGG